MTDINVLLQIASGLEALGIGILSSAAYDYLKTKFAGRSESCSRPSAISCASRVCVPRLRP